MEDVDIVCLQEVRQHNRKLEKHFTRWPDLDQASYLTPDGYAGSPTLKQIAAVLDGE